MRFLIFPLIIVGLIFLFYKIQRSSKVDRFIDKLTTKPKPDTSESLQDEVLRSKESLRQVGLTAGIRKEQNETENKRLSEIEKQVK